VVTYYNEPKEFLRECLDSIVGQTVHSWEAIIVDDGSDSRTASDIPSLFGDPRISLIRHDQNRGLGAARNTGVRAARAPLILFVDADDRLDPQYLEMTCQKLKSQPEADFVLTDFQLFGKSNDVWRFPVPLPPLCPVHFTYVGSGSLMRKRIWESVGGYAEEASVNLGVDLDFWLGAVERGFRPTHVAHPLYFYRRHSSARSVTNTMYNSHSRAEAVYRRHRKIFEVLGSECPSCKSQDRGATFLASGYLTSSIVSLQKGERWRAVRMAFHGFALQPKNPETQRQLLRTLLPGYSSGLWHKVTGRYGVNKR
jgi:GT2 family glycosyltransferase